MITFDPRAEISGTYAPVGWLVGILLGVLLVGTLYKIFTSKVLSSRRKAVRSTLHGLLVLVLAGYLLQPAWPRRDTARHAWVVSEVVPSAWKRKIQDSLGVKKLLSENEFSESLEESLGKPLVEASRYDSVTLVGQGFSETMLSQVPLSRLAWVPYYPDDQPSALHWQGLLRQGELQRVTGVVQSARRQWLAVRYAGRTLDSLEVPAGQQPFALEFPAFAQGRSTVALTLGEKVLDSLRFFTRPVPPLHFLLVLGSPDFESRTLAEWLGRQGHTVRVSTSVSRGIQSEVTINASASSAKVPDVILTDPAHASDARVKRALTAGKSVVFFNLTQPQAEVPAINRALGSTFALKQISSEATVPIQKELLALPYAFTTRLGQSQVPGYPVAVQKREGTLAVSLLTETFPLRLSGDSLAYERLWLSLLARVQPAFADHIAVDAPLLARQEGRLAFTNFGQVPEAVTIGQDTVPLRHSPINPRAAEVKYLFGRAGWVPLADSLEIYVDSSSSVASFARLAGYLRAQPTVGAGLVAPAEPSGQRLPGWAWLLLLITCLTALWVEPKIA
ncbi:hypothetical protein GCM10027275_00900 [Rhabdobacter roseus]|uniref:Uncharacterized protein n=1 Tax=Rhabdobacter roseus TaxID=1655419 RepID=A0A840TEP7_9BACT|nr:hypothetical protein [Rhabdobacter roseus]MBB5281974.1 hypothetical protein [Rhabdobacter roseus]